CMLGAIGWHQVMGRSEPGAARFHAVILALLFACVGVLMSWDLAELFGFWAIGGAMTYLLLAHRWGLDEPARRARVALALPFLTDLCLLCGIAWLYAGYGTQNLSSLLPALLSFLGNDPRRVIALAGSAAVAIGAAVVIAGFRSQPATFAVAGVAAVLAVAPARVAAGLALSSIASAMRTDDLTEMGDAWRRMRASSVALLASIVVLGLSGSVALALGVTSRSKLGVALGEGVLLIAIASLRVFLAVAF